MKKGFYTIMAAQFFSSLADNALFIAAIALIQLLEGPAWMTPMVKWGFAVSYVVLAAFVGAFADSMPKGKVMFITNSIKIVGCFVIFFYDAIPLPGNTEFWVVFYGYMIVGIGAAMAYTVGHSGLGVLANLAKLIGTLYLALAVFAVTVLLPMALWARVPVRRFLTELREPILLAFTTTSSDAAMPDAMKRLTALGVPKRIVSFVMPLGYSFNLDGSTLYLAVASVFVAQAAGVHLTISQQLVILLTLMLTSKGMAGIPRASQVILAGTLVSFDLPLEGVLLIIGVDELMDMARTTVNLVGNCLATAVVARWEGVFPPTDTTPSEP
jgi:proton glutamate symport protein